MTTSEERACLLATTCLRSLKEAAELIDKDPGIIHDRMLWGETAMQYLAVENELEAVRFLHEQGSDINTVNDYNETPMYQVASGGHVELARYLLENGAIIETESIALVSEEYGKMEPIIHHAVPSGDPAMIALLVEFGADINTRNYLDETPLHESAKHDERLRVTRYLVEKGADVNAVAAFHVTPLIKAALFGCTKTAKYLVSAGASLDIKDDHGRTAAKMARKHGYQELADWLEKKSMDK